MAQAKKLKATIFLVVVAVALVFVLKNSWFISGHQSVSVSNLRSKGNSRAAVQIVEYIDLQCPACANGAVILRDLMGRFPDKIHIQIKYFPLVTVHAHSIRSAVFTDCAALQGKFWPFYDRLMDRQGLWSKLPVADPEFYNIATEVGLDRQTLETCVADPKIPERIYKDKEAGSSLGIQSTPTYFINGKMVVGTKLLQEELNRLLPM